jgi:hypothetical protein
MDIVVIAILLIEIVGFSLGGVVIYRLRQQIGALKGTVEAQKDTLEVVGELNKIAIEMARASDPKRYLDMVETHEKLVQKNATAAMEDMRRSLEQEHHQTLEQSKRGFELAMQAWESALRVGLDLVAYVPPARRRDALASADVPQHLKEMFLKTAESAPDLSGDFSAAYRAVLGAALKINVQDTIVVTEPILPPPTAPTP